MKFIKANNRIYQLKFGLRALIALEDFSYLDEREITVIKFYLALDDPSLTIEDAEEIMSQLNCDVKALLDEVLYDSLGTAAQDSPYILSLKEQCEELYQLAVGKIGISPQVFFTMTPHEIELAYLGYLENKELDMTLNILAARQSKKQNTMPINLFGEEYKPSTIAERNKTFQSLGI